jgi:hypothetical protein
MSSRKLPKQRLVKVIKAMAKDRDVRRKLADLKVEARAWVIQPGFLWPLLVGSFASMGNAKAASRVDGRQLSFRKIGKITPAHRRRFIEAEFRRAGVRYPKRKAQWLVDDFNMVAKMGGANAATKALLALPGRDAKIAFLECLTGIGPKYARNLMMDTYDKHFLDAVAVDYRIQSISTVLGLAFKSYSDHEQFYVEVAREAGLRNAWELDRLLFNFKDEVIARLNSQRAKAS